MAGCAFWHALWTLIGGHKILFALRSSIGSVSFIRMMLHSSHSPSHMKRSHARETWSGATVIDFPEYFSDSRQKNPE